VKTCKVCGQPIPGQDYRIVGYEVEHGGIPTNITVHSECLPTYRRQQAAQGQPSC